MATKRVTINKSNGTSDTFTFNIPETVGTYNLKFTKSDGGVLNAGNIQVDGTQRTYRLTFSLSNGGSINVGTFTTPIIYCKVSYTVPTGVKWVRISLNKFPYTVFVDKATSAGTVNIPYGQEIFVQASPSTGYNNPNVNGSGTYYSVITPTSDTTINIVAGGKQTFTLSYPAKPAGVGSYTITRNGSTLVNSPTSAGTATIYYGDTLAISATAASGYNAPTYSLSATTVTGNVTATVTAGSVATQWRTIFSGSTTVTATSESGASKTISGLRAGVPTKATFSGTIEPNLGVWTNTITQRTLADSSNGVYSGSGHQTGNNGVDDWDYIEADYDYGFTLTMGANTVTFKPYVNGYFYDYCAEEYTADLSSASVTITEIQQYY